MYNETRLMHSQLSFFPSFSPYTRLRYVPDQDPSDRRLRPKNSFSADLFPSPLVRKKKKKGVPSPKRFGKAARISFIVGVAKLHIHQKTVGRVLACECRCCCGQASNSCYQQQPRKRSITEPKYLTKYAPIPRYNRYLSKVPYSMAFDMTKARV